MKDTFYFSHDYHSRSDEKILRIRAKYGAKGYGTFWMLVEIMAESSLPHIQLRDIPAIAVSINEDAEWLKKFIDFCIDEAKLFLCDGEEFTSKRMINHKIFRENFKTKGEEGAAKRWGHDSPPNSPPNAKERKGKDIKENIIIDILSDLNSVLNTNYKPSSLKTKELIQARVVEGHNLEDFKIVHRKMVKAWGLDNKMRQYLRPLTLYSNKFESYLNRPEDIKELTPQQQSNLKGLAQLNKELKNDNRLIQ